MRSPRLGIRARTTLAFAFLALLCSLVVSVGTYLAARHYLVKQRAGVAVRTAYLDARTAVGGLRAGSPVPDVLESVVPRAGTVVMLRKDGRWYAATPSSVDRQVPVSLREAVAGGTPSLQWTRVDGVPAVAVGIPLAQQGSEYYEVSAATELDATLATIRWAATGFSVLVTFLGGLLGAMVVRRVLAPLRTFAVAAGAVGRGQLGTRLPQTRDADLAVIVGSFNAMADSLETRVQRVVRFAADVAHELRSLVTTLAASVELLSRRRAGLPAQAGEVIDLVEREVERLQHTLDGLLELARLDAGTTAARAQRVWLPDLVQAVLERTHRPAALLVVDNPRMVSLNVRVDKERMARVLVNLLDNADRHAGA